MKVCARHEQAYEQQCPYCEDKPVGVEESASAKPEGVAEAVAFMTDDWLKRLYSYGVLSDDLLPPRTDSMADLAEALGIYPYDP